MKFGRGPGFNSQSGPFSFFSSLWSHTRKRDLEAVYSCWERGTFFGKYHTIRRPKVHSHPTSLHQHLYYTFQSQNYYHTISPWAQVCHTIHRARIFFTDRATHATWCDFQLEVKLRRALLINQSMKPLNETTILLSPDIELSMGMECSVWR